MRWGTSIVDHARSYPDGPKAERLAGGQQAGHGACQPR